MGTPRLYRATDHPRVCGEQDQTYEAAFPYVGSPPRVRGTGRVHDDPEEDYGITPACAGNSFQPTSKKASCKDHPRVCGEQPGRPAADRAGVGSPPRVRGTVPPPAYIIKQTLDHPRVCGEQFGDGAPVLGEAGSPPRVRGTDNYASILYAADRITPACAGNSAACRAGGMAAEDHPRVCGEQGGDRGAGCVHQGSPPRVRGTASKTTFANSQARITPACAGNSRPVILQGLVQLGSPPRVRGTGNPAAPNLWAARITPACAGNSPPFCMQIGGLGDHPRVCGEQFTIRLPYLKRAGSPPRVRGTDQLQSIRV